MSKDWSPAGWNEAIGSAVSRALPGVSLEDFRYAPSDRPNTASEEEQARFRADKAKHDRISHFAAEGTDVVSPAEAERRQAVARKQRHDVEEGEFDPAILADAEASAHAIANSPNATPTERKEALAQANNIRREREAREALGGPIQKTLDAYTFGAINEGPNRTLNMARERGLLTTGDDLANMGIRDYRGRKIATEDTRIGTQLEDMATTGIGQLPYFMLGGAAASAGAKALLPLAGEGKIGAMLGRVAEGMETTAQRGTLARTGQRVVRGATQGAFVGGAGQFATETRQGIDPGQAAMDAAISTAFGGAMGGVAEAGAGLVMDLGPARLFRYANEASRAVGAARVIEAAHQYAGDAQGFIDEMKTFAARGRRMNEEGHGGLFARKPDLPAIQEEALGVDRERGDRLWGGRYKVAQALEKIRAAKGQLPVGDKMPEAQAQDISAALEAVLAQKQDAAREAARGEQQQMYEEMFGLDSEHAWPRASQEEPLIQPGTAYDARERRPVEGDVPLRSAREVGLARAGVEEPLRASEEANAVRQMERQQAAAEAEQRARAEEENDPNVRLERAAQAAPQNVQGPKTLAETLATTREEVDAGEPLATEYHDAINKYADALVAAKDEGEKPKGKTQVALARARQALNVARKKYGAQLGASAVLALAAADDDLTDDEKKLVGLGGVAVLGSTEVVRAMTEGAARRAREAISAHPPHFEQSARQWLHDLDNYGHLNEPGSYTTLSAELRRMAGDGDGMLTRAQVDEALSHDANRQIPHIPAGLREETRLRIEGAFPDPLATEPAHVWEWHGRQEGMTEAQVEHWREAMERHPDFDEDGLSRRAALEALDEVSPDDGVPTAAPHNPVPDEARLSERQVERLTPLITRGTREEQARLEENIGSLDGVAARMRDEFDFTPAQMAEFRRRVEPTATAQGVVTLAAIHQALRDMGDIPHPHPPLPAVAAPAHQITAGVREQVQRTIEDDYNSDHSAVVGYWAAVGRDAGMTEPQIDAWRNAMRAHPSYDGEIRPTGAIEALRTLTGDAAPGTAVAEPQVAREGPQPRPASKGLISRLRTYIEDLKGNKGRWDRPYPVGDWLDHLRSADEFSKKEFEMYLEPALRQMLADDPKARLTREELLGVYDKHGPQLERVTLGGAQEKPESTGMRVNEDADPDDIADIDTLEEDHATNAPVLEQQIANREERIAQINREIEERQEEARRDMEYADDEATRYANELRNISGIDGVDDAIDYLREHVYGDHIPSNAVDRALAKIDFDNIPSDARGMLEANGYKIETETLDAPPAEEDYAIVDPNRPGQPEWLPTRDRAERLAETRSRLRGREHTVMSAEEWQAENRFDEPTELVVVRDADGKAIAHDEYEDDAVQKAIEVTGFDPDETRDNAYSEARSALDSYAEAYARYSEHESTHYAMTEDEGEYFSNEVTERERLEEEVPRLRALADAAPGATPNVPALPAPETEQSPYLMPIVPEPKGATHFTGAQMLPGGYNERNLITRLVNTPDGKTIPSAAYGGVHDYWSGRVPNDAGTNSMGHVRGKDYDVQATPGLGGERVEFTPGEPEAVRLDKSKVVETRKKLEVIRKEQRVLADEFEAMSEDEREGTRAMTIRSEFIDRETRAEDLLKREQQLAASIRQKLGIQDAPQRVAVMVENQASLAQYQVTVEPRGPEWQATKTELETKLQAAAKRRETATKLVQDLQDERDRLRGQAAIRNAESRLLSTAEQYNAPLADEYARKLAEWRAAGRGWETRPVQPETIDTYYLMHGTDAERQHAIASLPPDATDVREAGTAYSEAAKPLYDLKRQIDAADREYGLAANAENAIDDQLRAHLRSGKESVVGIPWTDTSLGWSLNAARFLIDCAERGYDMMAWSDAGNRILHAHLPMAMAKRVYDQVTPKAIRGFLDRLGFKDVKIEKMAIAGGSHWAVRLTPEMRAAIRRYGVPFMTVMAMMAAPKDASAQGTDGESGSGSIYGTVVGSMAAGAALAYAVTSKKARRLLADNAELRRALLRDDLTQLANGRAFRNVRGAIDRDAAHGWAVFDGQAFKQINDNLGHSAGDRALQHFADTIRRTLADMGVSPQAYRYGGDEFAVALPKEHLAEFVRRIEEASAIELHGNDLRASTRLTGAHGDTFDVADGLANARKEEMRRADPSLRRRASDTPARMNALSDEVGKALDRAGYPTKLYSNPIGPALAELRRVPGAATVAAVGALAMQSDTEEIHDAGVPLIALGALSAIGSHRLIAGKDRLASAIVEQLSKTEDGTRLVRFFNPDALLSPEVKEAIASFEQGRAKGAARAAEFSQKAKALGPQGDRAASDLIEGEQWEDTSNMSPEDLTAALSVAVELQQEYDRVAQEKIAAGVMDPGAKLPNYGGARRYAHYDAESALAESPAAASRGRAAGRNPRIGAQKTRTLDIPIREAEAELRAAQAAGDPRAITAAQDKLDQAKVVQMSQRVERGEIREQSYRSAYTIEKGYADAEAAKLFNALRNIPGTAHPEWVQGIDDLRASQALVKAATNPADRAAAQQLVDDVKVKLDELARRYRRKGAEWVTLPDTPGMGSMRGAIVQRDVANSLVGFSDRANAYTKLVQWWKEAKTVFNPGTSAANIMSNIAFSHLEGLSIHEQPVFLTRALKDMKKYGDATRALAERGVLDQNAVTSSAIGRAGKVERGEAALEQLLPTTRPETQAVLRKQGITEGRIANKQSAARGRAALGGALTGAALLYDDENPDNAAVGGAVGAGIGAAMVGRRGAFRNFYQSEDNVFRVALYLKRRALGDTEEQAAKFAGEALGNFRSRSPALQVARQTVAPFLLYPAKALPRFAQRMIDNPIRYLTLMAAWGAINELSKQEVGDVPESDLAIRDRRSALGYFLPGFTQLPFTNERGERAAVDMARWTPVASATTLATPGSVPGSIDERTPDILRAGGPAVDLAARFGANADTFTGEPRYKLDFPPKENIGRLLNDAAETVLPQALGFHRERLTTDIKNADWDKFKNDLLGPTGLRPRYVRPGANVMGASFTLEQSLREMKQALKVDLRNNRNPGQIRTITDRYMRRVANALSNYRDRVGAPPPDDLVREYLDGHAP